MTKNRVTNVQVPGETPQAANESEASQPQTEPVAGGEQPSSEGAKSEVITDAHVGGVFETVVSRAPVVDIEAIRAQAKAEVLAELQAEFQTAKAALTAQVARAEPGIATARSYKDMRAHEVDPDKLTAPVLTKDGWVCPSIPPTMPAAFKQ